MVSFGIFFSLIQTSNKTKSPIQTLHVNPGDTVQYPNFWTLDKMHSILQHKQLFELQEIKYKHLQIVIFLNYGKIKITMSLTYFFYNLFVETDNTVKWTLAIVIIFAIYWFIRIVWFNDHKGQLKSGKQWKQEPAGDTDIFRSTQRKRTRRSIIVWGRWWFWFSYGEDKRGILRNIRGEWLIFETAFGEDWWSGFRVGKTLWIFFMFIRQKCKILLKIKHFTSLIISSFFLYIPKRTSYWNSWSITFQFKK